MFVQQNNIDSSWNRLCNLIMNDNFFITEISIETQINLIIIQVLAIVRTSLIIHILNGVLMGYGMDPHKN